MTSVRQSHINSKDFHLFEYAKPMLLGRSADAELRRGLVQVQSVCILILIFTV